MEVYKPFQILNRCQKVCDPFNFGLREGMGAMVHVEARLVLGSIACGYTKPEIVETRKWYLVIMKITYVQFHPLIHQSKY